MMDAQSMAIMENVGRGILQQAELEEKKLDQQLKSLENLGSVLCNDCDLLFMYW